MKALLLTLLLALSLAGMAQAQDRHYKPTPKLTPGDAFNVTADDLCKPGHAEIEGKISVQVKSHVFDRYGIRGDLIGYNVDHLIPPELGGSNSLKNLWPQPLAGEWTYHMKNRLERRLRKLVCSGALDLKTAQQEIAMDWIGAYKKYLSGLGQVQSNRWKAAGSHERSWSSCAAKLDRFEDIEHEQFGEDGYEDAVKQIGDIEGSLELAKISQFTAPPPPKLWATQQTKGTMLKRTNIILCK